MSGPDHRSAPRRPRHAYSPSPSPTLVGSEHSAPSSSSTISLPRHTDTDEPRSADGQRSRDQDVRAERQHDAVAKLAVIFGLLQVVAGALHLWKRREAKRRGYSRNERPYGDDRRRREGRDREGGRERRGQRDWEEWQERSQRPRLTGGYAGSSAGEVRQRIDYRPSQERSQANTTSRGYR